ncbi:unnamed protein product [Rotaria sordida]|uniref:Uncharacterized protein n=1 Tax=Rotaria sordida TaxID=392033 RepID=A0A814QH26_9BILA|nr:unnamed protein product [Rotaria sordida]
MLKITVDTSILPKNIFSLHDQHFYDIIIQVTGSEGIVDLLKAQGINNISAFLLTSDIFEILTWDADEFIDLQKRCSIELRNNTFMIRPGLKANIEYLRELFTKKNEEYAKELKHKQQQQQHRFSLSPITTDLSLTSTSTIDTSNNSNSFSTPTTNFSAPLTTTTTSDDPKQIIINTIEKWSIENVEFFDNNDFVLTEGVHYDLIIRNMNDVFIQCKCNEKDNQKCTLMRKLRGLKINDEQQEQIDDDSNTSTTARLPFLSSQPLYQQPLTETVAVATFLNDSTNKPTAKPKKGKRNNKRLAENYVDNSYDTKRTKI